GAKARAILTKKRRSGSAAALGFPAASAVAAAPRARPDGSRQAAGADGALAAGAHGDGHGAVGGHFAADGRGARALIDHGALGNSDGIAVGAVAGAFFGDDHDAPHAVEAGG